MKHLGLGLVILSLAACDTGSGTAPAKDSPPSKLGAAATGQAKPAATARPQTKPAATAVFAKGPFPQSKHEAMKAPKTAKDAAPAEFAAVFDTTVGSFTLNCKREWAPNGVDRFYNLVKIGFFDDVAFFRAVRKFVIQFGIHGDPEVSKVWRNANIERDPVKQGNKRGFLTYAMAKSPDTRSTQLFINLKDNDSLDKMGFAALCEVDANGMAVVGKIHTGYGEKAGRDQANIQTKGNKHLRERYPRLDYIKTARIVGADGEDDGAKPAAKKTKPAAKKTKPAAKKTKPAAKKTKPAAK